MINNLSALTTQVMPYLCILIAYLLGSIPTSYLIGRIFFHTDIRKRGSGNTGATNTLRTFGATAGAFVLLIDVLKGVAAILIARHMINYVSAQSTLNIIVSLSGLMVIIGHIFSVFLGLKGGKGVATAAGVFLALSPIPFLFCAVFFIFTVIVTRYVSLGSILSAFAFLVVELVSQVIMRFPNLPRLLLVSLVVIIIIVRHKGNIKRLVGGEENKISFRKPRQSY